VIDNLRYDQWKTKVLVGNYKLEKIPTPILPYSNAICERYFLRFDTIRNGKQFPQYWKNDPEEKAENFFEAEFF
jgi:hypothetical protein